MGTRNVTVVVFLLSLLLCWSESQGLNPRGRNVCESGSDSVQCCSGWAQQGDECLKPLCEGNFTCKENEVCVRPNECRCRHGYFGATCDMKCPSQFWGPDCKGKCTCHPNGQCDDVTGACTCNPNRWGVNCELPCGCQKGACSQETGACTCYQGFWGEKCSNKCYCSVNSVCDLTTGQCHCNPGWYGQVCNAQCSCNGSPCEQLTGRCKCRERLWSTHCERTCQCVHGRCNQADGTCTCRPGFRGKFCREPCPAGFYGQNCRNRCGHCKGQQPCKVTEGRCVTCERGWNGTRCDQMCAAGFYGENCQDVCSPCKDGHFCNRIDGNCPHCNPGWMGDRCEIQCPNGTYGDNCAFECKDCFNGMCHYATGECLCDPGFHGAYCNVSCEAGQYGVNCAQTCSCHDNTCNPQSGACNLQPNQRMGVMAAGVLVSSLLLLLLVLLCCCCLCRQRKLNDPENKAKTRLCGGFTRISSKLPRIPLRRQKLPKVVVSQQDPENTFNCSFIEPPAGATHPSPSSTSPSSPRGSLTSVETAEDGPGLYAPNNERVQESRKKDRINVTETTVLTEDDDGGGVSEVETLPDDLDTAEQGAANHSAGQQSSTHHSPPAQQASANQSEPTGQQQQQASVSANPGEPRGQRASESEGSSCSGSEAAAVSISLKPPAPQPPPQAVRQNDNNARRGASKAKENGTSGSAERVKPRPPDPATKPKVSWIHAGTAGASHNQISQEETVVEEEESQNRGKKASKPMSVSPEQEASSAGPDEGGRGPALKIRPGLVPLGTINGAVQSVLRKMNSFRGNKKTTNPTTTTTTTTTTTEPSPQPKSSSPSHSREPHINAEAASLLAAQLKEKTQSLSRSEGRSGEENSLLLSHPQTRKKPAPLPQKTSTPAGLHGSGKALVPASSPHQKPRGSDTPLAKEAKGGERRRGEEERGGEKEKQDCERPEKADLAVKKTPIKKPPRKKTKDGGSDSNTQTEAKVAVMPPQVVN